MYIFIKNIYVVFWRTIIVLWPQVLFSQQDSLLITINLSQYELVANIEFRLKTYEENDSLTQFNRFFTFYQNNSISDFKIRSIPVFELSKKAAKYKCGDPIEQFIVFDENPDLQKVVISNKFGKFDQFDIAGKVHKLISDISIGSIIYPNESILHPIVEDSYTSSAKVFRFLFRHPEQFVFMIKDIPGYWVVSGGELHGLVGKIKVRKVNASLAFSWNGEDYIRDVVNESIRIGKPYFQCKKSNNTKKKKTLIVIKKNT